MTALIILLLNLGASLFKPKSWLEAENAALRQQLTVLQRKVRGRVQLTNSDRLFFIQLYRWFPSILKAMRIVRPDTLVRWHRAGFRRYWRWKSRNPGGRPHIDAGMASHHVARELVALGHEVKQVPPAYSKPFRQGHKNDFRDAHAVAEAVERPSTRCVPIKTDGQLDLQALHRVRSRLIGNRTAVINQIRGFLLEHGIPVRQGHHFLRKQLPLILATRTDVLSPRMIRIIGDLMADWKYLDERIERVTDEIEALAHADEGCQQLITVPGIGPIISSAMVAAIGNGAAFCKGRDFAAWLGLVPK